MKTWGFEAALTAVLLLGVGGLESAFAGDELETVDAVIVFAVDVSSSVSDDSNERLGIFNEYLAQRNGLVEALRNPQLHHLFERCTREGVAVAYAEWSGSDTYAAFQPVIDWQRLRSREDLLKFADRVEHFGSRTSRGATDIAGALFDSLDLISQSHFQSGKSVIFLSSDGRQGMQPYRFRHEPRPERRGPHVYLPYLHRAREAADAQGVSISVLGIVDRNEGIPTEAELIEYHNDHVVTGPYRFVTPVQGFRDYARGIHTSMMRLLNNCHL